MDPNLKSETSTTKINAPLHCLDFHLLWRQYPEPEPKRDHSARQRMREERTPKNPRVYFGSWRGVRKNNFLAKHLD
jgi:hypothetical protein